MDKRKKFNSKPVSQRLVVLWCAVILGVNLGISSAVCAEPLLADQPISNTQVSKPATGLLELPAKDRLAPLKARLAEQYPDVHHLSIEDYLTHYPQALLVDVRGSQEYAVSRIPGAVHIEDRAELLAFAQAHKSRQLILYCSVGARSAEAAQFLQQQAADHEVGEIANLAGSIFEWANEKRPLENAAGATTEVHPFNAWWGWRYLD